MTTRGTLKTDVIAWLARDDLSESVFSTCVKQAEARLARDLRSGAQVAYTTVTPTSQSFALPDGYIRGISTTVDTTGKPLRFLPSKVLRERPEFHQNAKYPEFFSLEGDNVLLAPAQGATSTVTITLVYYKKMDAIEQESETNWLLTDNYDLMLYLVTSFCALYFQEFELADELEAMFENGLSRLHSLDAVQQHGGTIIEHFGDPAVVV